MYCAQGKNQDIFKNVHPSVQVDVQPYLLDIKLEDIKKVDPQTFLHCAKCWFPPQILLEHENAEWLRVQHNTWWSIQLAAWKCNYYVVYHRKENKL